MPRRREDEPLQKVGFSVYQSDWEWLKANFPNAGPHRTARKIIRRFRVIAETKAARSLHGTATPVTLDDSELADGVPDESTG